MRIAECTVDRGDSPKTVCWTERWFLGFTEELVALGHDVTRFASGDSQTSAKIEPMWPRACDWTIRCAIRWRCTWPAGAGGQCAAEFDVRLPSRLFPFSGFAQPTALH